MSFALDATCARELAGALGRYLDTGFDTLVMPRETFHGDLDFGSFTPISSA